MESTECGAASLAMIFAYYGRYMSLEQMRIETGVTRDGCNAGNIMRAAKKYGLDCHGYRKEPEALRTVKTPCIIHWNFNHFVVFEGIRGKHAYINDPAAGRRKLTMEELDESFTGIILTFALTPEFQKVRRENSFRELLARRLKGRYGILAELFFIGLLLFVPGFVLPVLSRIFVDEVLSKGNVSVFGTVLVCTGLMILLKAALTCIRKLIMQRFRSKMILLSGNSFLRHLLRLPMGFYDQRSAGDLLERMECNTDINDFLTGDLAECALNMLVSVFYLAVLLRVSPVLTAIGLVSVAVNLSVVALSNRVVADSALRIQISSGKLYGTVCAGLNITDSLKAAGAESAYAGRVLGYQARQAVYEQKFYRFQQIVGAIPDAVGSIAGVLLLAVGGSQVMRGTMTMGLLLAFTSLFDSFCTPVNALVSFVNRIQTMKANVSRVEDIERYGEDACFSRQTGMSASVAAYGKLRGEVQMENVSFGYSSLKDPLIADFSFSLESGQTLAIVGGSGCGKSTVSKLASGLYQPWSGAVLLDGVPLEEIPRELLNASVATVSQNISLFSGSIRDNLTMWNDAVLESEMIRAAKDACIDGDINSLPGGYDYQLTENADNLSGGQRQRLEIARALATNPSVLIMDEATSALDPIVEKQILDNIRKRGCTCIIVAHRLSTIRDCGEILVMQNGRIVQRGTHASLMAEDGYYRQFIRNA